MFLYVGALVLTVGVFFFRGCAGGRTSEHLDNVTQTIEMLLDGYDIRLRPNFGGEYSLTSATLIIYEPML